MPRRNLEEEFDTILPLFKATPAERVKEFATLYISTLQVETKPEQRSELSKKFPLTVRLWAMQKMRNSFKSRLKLDGFPVDRWMAEQELRLHDQRLHKLLTKEQETVVGWWLDKCTTSFRGPSRSPYGRGLLDLSSCTDLRFDP